MNENQEEIVEIDLGRLLGALWHRVWLIVLAMLACGAAAFCVARYLIAPNYEASALMYVNNSSISVGSTSVSLSDLSASKSLVSSYTVIMKTRLTLNEVIKEANLDYTYEELVKMIDAAAEANTEIFRITVTSKDPREAALIANTITEVLPDKIAEIINGCTARTVDLAVVPNKPSNPNVVKITIAGAVLGLLMSAGIVILLEIMDKRIHDEDFLVQTYGFPVLAVVPDLLSKAERDTMESHPYYSVSVQTVEAAKKEAKGEQDETPEGRT